MFAVRPALGSGILGSRAFVALISAGLCLFGSPGPARAHTGDELWQIVSDGCVVDQMRSGNPAPCVVVDLDGGADNGYAVFKDMDGARQFLLLPTARITGIESPILLEPGAADYFAAAWRARHFTEVAAGRSLPADWVSLAVNPVAARSQDQLHIHIDCLRADVHDALQRFAADLGPTWTPFPVPLAGNDYYALAADSLDSPDPFQLLAASLDELGGGMAERTLVVVGAEKPDGTTGFVILTNRVPAVAGPATVAGEQLQDHDSCPAPRLGK